MRIFDNNPAGKPEYHLFGSITNSFLFSETTATSSPIPGLLKSPDPPHRFLSALFSTETSQEIGIAPNPWRGRSVHYTPPGRWSLWAVIDHPQQAGVAHLSFKTLMTGRELSIFDMSDRSNGTISAENPMHQGALVW
jgi:hypothetical protein